jgi:uncharacterized membrane protein
VGYAALVAESTRVKAFDWLRGLAVIFMVETHSLVLLRPELRQGPGFARLNFINGLVAPSFIFAAGFSLALTQVRSAKAGARATRIRRTARRIGEVLAVGTLLNVMWFWYPLHDSLHWLLRIDILQCIAFSLLIALPLIAGLAKRPNVLAAVTFALGLGVFLASPFAEQVRGPLASVFNNSGDSVFPLTPWAGYVYLGAATGAIAASRSIVATKRWLLILLGLGAALWALGPVWQGLYPPHNFFVTDPANHGRRWVWVTGLLLVLLEVETRYPGPWRESLPMRWIDLFGTSSLAGYFFHEALIYYRVFGFSFAAVWRDACGWPKYLALLACLLALTTVLTWITDRVYRVLDAKTKPAPAK